MSLSTGRPVKNDKRELVSGRRSHGHVALYRYIVEIDTVLSSVYVAKKRLATRSFEPLLKSRCLTTTIREGL